MHEEIDMRGYGPQSHYSLSIQAPKLNKIKSDWVTFKSTNESQKISACQSVV